METVREECRDKERFFKMSYTKIIAIRLRELRKKRGLTQTEAAEGIGVSRSTLASWETGIREPNALELDGIRQYFNVSGDYIMGFSDQCTSVNIPKVYDIDLNRLNSLGKQTLFEMYNFLAQNDLYKK